MTLNIMQQTFNAMEKAAAFGKNNGEDMASKLMAAAQKKVAGEKEPTLAQLVDRLEGRVSEGGNTRMLKNALGMVQKRASGEGSDAGSAKQVANLLKAILPFISKGKEQNSDTSGSKEVRNLLKALTPLVENGISREKASDEANSGMSMKSVKNLMQSVLDLVEQAGGDDEEEDEPDFGASTMGNLLKSLMPFVMGGSGAATAGAGVGKDLGSILSSLSDSMSGMSGGKADSTDNKAAKPATTAKTCAPAKTDAPAPVTADKTSGTEGGEKVKSEVKDGMSAANKAIPLLMKLLEASEVTPKGDQSFTGQNLLDILSNKDGNKIKLSDAGFAGGKGPAGEFSSEDGKVKIANKDGSALGTSVEVDLKNLFSNRGSLLSPAKDKINELATLNVTYANGKQELISATGADSDQNGNQTVKLGNGKDQIKSVDFALPKGATEKASDGTDNKSDAGIGAVRMSGAKSDPSEVKESILELLPAIAGRKEADRAA